MKLPTAVCLASWLKKSSKAESAAGAYYQQFQKLITRQVRRSRQQEPVTDWKCSREMFVSAGKTPAEGHN
jgi:hypothetical protein